MIDSAVLMDEREKVLLWGLSVVLAVRLPLAVEREKVSI